MRDLSLFEKVGVVHEAGNVAEEELAPDEVNTRRGYTLHLAAHAVLEEILFGKVSKDLNIFAACPYCGKLPPDPA